MEKTIEELIYEETEKRLKEMSAADYAFPKRADKKDVVGIIAAAVASLILIILCMAEVII